MGKTSRSTSTLLPAQTLRRRKRRPFVLIIWHELLFSITPPFVLKSASPPLSSNCPFSGSVAACLFSWSIGAKRSKCFWVWMLREP